MVCSKCGALLVDPKTSTIHLRVNPDLIRLKRRPNPETGPLPSSGEGLMVHLQIRGLSERLFFEEGTSIVLGRIDVTSPDMSRFDLTRFGGHERGVSREHCALEMVAGRLQVTDLGSVNGTFINGTRLDPNIPHLLKNGDELMLGSLSITVRYGTEPLNS
jgi:hypothetical protein